MGVVGGQMNVVSERLNWRAISCICGFVRVLDVLRLFTTARGLPL